MQTRKHSGFPAYVQDFLDEYRPLLTEEELAATGQPWLRLQARRYAKAPAAAKQLIKRALLLRNAAFKVQQEELRLTASLLNLHVVHYPRGLALNPYGTARCFLKIYATDSETGAIRDLLAEFAY